MRNYTTQMDAARRGIVTPEIETVAKKENMPVDKLMQLVAEGKVAICANKNHTCLDPEGVGSMLRTKINVNLGVSLDCKDYDIEMQKVMSAVNMGAGRAVKQLQEAMNATGETQLDHYSPIAEDGIMGPDTRELANALADVHLDWYAARSSLRLRDAFYRRLAASRPSMKVFLTGWRNRVKALHQHLADLEREAQ